jgi:hypothetical protein
VTFVGSYLWVVVVTDVLAVVQVDVEESCCAPLQTYCLLSSAVPSSPTPKKRAPYWNAQAKSPQFTFRVCVTLESSWILFFASLKHVVESGISS